MPPPDSLSELQETMLFAIWKLRGIGNNAVSEDQLRAQMTNQPAQNIASTLRELKSQGFIDISDNSGRDGFSITPLGLAILRKVEEDKLQEIK
jgi:predicted transcriptional regulator